jgi:hypothetical protein
VCFFYNGTPLVRNDTSFARSGTPFICSAPLIEQSSLVIRAS